MLRELKKNKNGVVYITVLMITIVLMVLTLSIMSLNVSQVTSSEKEIKRIKAEALAQGMVAYVYTKAQTQYNGMTRTYSNSYTMNETYDTSTYIMTGSPNQPENMLITVTY